MAAVRAIVNGEEREIFLNYNSRKWFKKWEVCYHHDVEIDLSHGYDVDNTLVTKVFVIQRFKTQDQALLFVDAIMS